MTGVDSTAAAGCIAIQYARFDAPGNDATNLNGEYVVVTNKCSTLIGVGGWRVRDKAGNAYRFAAGVRMGKGSIYVHSGKGTNRPGHRYWGRTTPVWNNTGEVAHLLNASGTRVSTWPRVTSTPTPSPDHQPVVDGVRHTTALRGDHPDGLPRSGDLEPHVQGPGCQRHRDQAGSVP